ncbi:hypothetical protein LY78DRAFT_650235 [Colletotrichum sublineola]|nr:hypothetical protein LY78DRAFT_650235 [Colletotrichum sublineola]
MGSKVEDEIVSPVGLYPTTPLSTRERERRLSASGCHGAYAQPWQAKGTQGCASGNFGLGGASSQLPKSLINFAASPTPTNQKNEAGGTESLLVLIMLSMADSRDTAHSGRAHHSLDICAVLTRRVRRGYTKLIIYSYVSNMQNAV